MEFYAVDLARAWRAVAIASSDDQERPVLCRTVCAHVFEERGLRLTATDSYILATAWVPVALGSWDGPSLDEVPDEEWVVCDADRRLIGLMAHAWKIATGKDVMPEDHTIRVGRTDPTTEPGQFPGMESPAPASFRLDATETLLCPVLDMPYPGALGILAAHATGSVAAAALSPDMAKRLAAVARVMSPAPMVWEFGPLGYSPVRFRCAEPFGLSVDGIWMPVRTMGEPPSPSDQQLIEPTEPGPEDDEGVPW